MPSQPVPDDGLSSSPISSPPDSVLEAGDGFEGEGEDEGGKSPAPAAPSRHGGSPTIMEQLEAMEKAKLESDGSQPAEAEAQAEPEIRVATDKKRAARSAARSTKPPPAKKTKTSRQWDPQFLLEDPNSPLAKVDIRALLSHPRAWSVLSLAERREVLAKFPGDEFVLDAGTDAAAPDIQALRNNNNFRHDAARYAENLARGFHDPQWVREAWTAHERRAAGAFDGFRVRKFEEDWEVELPEAMRPPRRGRGGAAEAGSGPGSAEPDELAGEPGAPATAEKTERPVGSRKASQGRAGGAMEVDRVAAEAGVEDEIRVALE